MDNISYGRAVQKIAEIIVDPVNIDSDDRLTAFKASYILSILFDRPTATTIRDIISITEQAVG